MTDGNWMVFHALEQLLDERKSGHKSLDDQFTVRLVELVLKHTKGGKEDAGPPEVAESPPERQKPKQKPKEKKGLTPRELRHVRRGGPYEAFLRISDSRPGDTFSVRDIADATQYHIGTVYNAAAKALANGRVERISHGVYRSTGVPSADGEAQQKAVLSAEVIEARKGGAYNACLRIVEAANGATVSTKDVASVTEYNYNTILKALSKACADNRIVRVDDGQYRDIISRKVEADVTTKPVQASKKNYLSDDNVMAYADIVAQAGCPVSIGDVSDAVGSSWREASAVLAQASALGLIYRASPGKYTAAKDD